MLFKGYKTAQTNSAVFAGIWGQKENSTSGNEAGTLLFYTNPNTGVLTERMRIDSNGNVGIGTATPSSFKLEIAGNIGPDGDLTRDLGSASKRWNNLYVGTVVGGATSSGNINPSADNTYDLGTTSLRWRKVEVGPGSLELTSTTGTSGAGANYTLGKLEFATNNLKLSTSAVGSGNTGTLQLTTGANVGLNIDTSGNVGIGTTSPNLGGIAGTALTILGSSTNRGTLELGSTTATTGPVGDITGFSGSTATQKIQFAGDGVNTDAGYIKFFTKATSTAIAERMRIDTNGNVGIGTTNPTYQLQATSQARIGSVTIGALDATNNSLLVHADGAGVGIIRNIKINGSLTLSGDNVDNGGLIVLYGRADTGGSGFSMAGGQVNSDIATRNSTITGVHAYASAVTNVNGGNIIFNGGAKTSGSGGTDGNVILANTRGNVGIGTTAPDVYSLGLTKQVTISTNGASVSSASIAIAGGTTGSARIDLGNESILRSAIQGINGSHLTLSTNAANSGTTLTERLRIQSDGNVGIGTTAPSTKFEVAGYTTISGSASHLGFNNPTTQQIFGPYGSTAAGGYSFNNDADTGFSRFAADTVGIVTGGSERLRVDSTGNVGIGTSAPGKTLEVAGNNTTSAYTPLRLRNTNGTIGVTWDFNLGTDKGLNLSSSSGNSSFSISPSSAALNAFYINNAGNVGIGTTGPNNNLHIIGASNTNSGIFVEDVAGSRILISGSRSTTGVPYIGTFSSSTPLTLGTNGNETMRLTTAGNVGIGTTAPTFNLDIQNATGTTLLRAKNTGSSNAGIILASDNNGGYITNNASLLTSEAIYFQNSTNLMRLYAAGAEKARLSSTGLQLFGTGSVLVVDGTGNSSFAGNVGIGTTAPGSKFEISGSNSDPSGALSNVGVVRIGTAATNGLDIGASSSSPFGVWLPVQNNQH